jgi:hypothetical protein
MCLPQIVLKARECRIFTDNMGSPLAIVFFGRRIFVMRRPLRTDEKSPGSCINHPDAEELIIETAQGRNLYCRLSDAAPIRMTAPRFYRDSTGGV